MSEVQCVRPRGGASRDAERASVALGLAEWLCLAATPTFAILAALTALCGGSSMNEVCSPGASASLGGMAPMYLLMSAFHAPPWLKLMFGGRDADRPAVSSSPSQGRPDPLRCQSTSLPAGE
jgi:hypothetical protein